MEAPIKEFLASRRVALVGLSRNPKDFSRMLDVQFRERDGLDAGLPRIWLHRGGFRVRVQGGRESRRLPCRAIAGHQEIGCVYRDPPVGRAFPSR